jgi:amino acid transporter
MLQRRLGLFQATAINMIDMVGIGPFITLPMVIAMMNGPHFLYAWFAGALLSIVDAMVWSELGAAFPKAGGSYNFLKEAYGKHKLGKLMSFLFVWQTMIQAPLVIASASIGFSAYLNYLVPLSTYAAKAVSGGVVVLIVILLYRRIDQVGKISVFLWLGVVFTLLWITIAGFVHGNMMGPLRALNSEVHFDFAFVSVLGFASVKTVYSFLGYYNVCHLGGEIKEPAKNIPRSMFLSIFGIAFLYLALNLSVTSVIPWQEAMHYDYVVSVFAERLMGKTAAIVLTALILWVAFASVFSATLGYSRIPYAAAVDGAFFKVFAKLHPTRNFPHVSLLALGSIAFVFSLLFKLSEVISAIIAMRILVQFVGQAIGLMLLRKSRPAEFFPYKMPLYPLPVLVAISLWLFILFSTGTKLIVSGLVVITVGLLVYLIKERLALFKNKS